MNHNNHMQRMGQRISLFFGKSEGTGKRDFGKNMVDERIDYIMKNTGLSYEDAVLSLEIPHRVKQFFGEKESLHILQDSSTKHILTFFERKGDNIWTGEELEFLFDQMKSLKIQKSKSILSHIKERVQFLLNGEINQDEEGVFDPLYNRLTGYFFNHGKKNFTGKEIIDIIKNPQYNFFQNT